MTLEEALERLNIWKEKNPNWVSAQKQSLEIYGQVFHPNKLDQLTRDKFKGFLLFKNNKHWTGIQRQGGQITAAMEKLRAALRTLLDESKPIKYRLDTLFPRSGESYVKGLGRAVATPILMVVYPEKYGVYNSISEAGLEKIGLLPKLKSSEAFSKRYLAVNNVLVETARSRNVPLFLLDTMFSIIVQGEGAFPQAGQGEAQEIGDTEGFATVGSARFALEKHLEDFLVQKLAEDTSRRERAFV